MSQEELITQCKRQLMLLKNLKSKCDHLQNNLKEKNENDEVSYLVYIYFKMFQDLFSKFNGKVQNFGKFLNHKVR